MFFTLQLKKSVTNIIDVIDCASAEGLFRLENWDFGSGKKSRCEKEKFPKRAVYLGDKEVHTLPAEKNLKKNLEMKILAAKKMPGNARGPVHIYTQQPKSQTQTVQQKVEECLLFNLIPLHKQ